MSEMEYREVTVNARVYSGSDDHAKHGVFWALSESEHIESILIDEIKIGEK
jgi:hypothetical protein